MFATLRVPAMQPVRPFGRNEGFETFVNYAQPPTKDRTENLPQRNIIQVYNGDKGWTLDRGGVSDAPPTDIARFQEGVKKRSVAIFFAIASMNRT